MKKFICVALVFVAILSFSAVTLATASFSHGFSGHTETAMVTISSGTYHVYVRVDACSSTGASLAHDSYNMNTDASKKVSATHHNATQGTYSANVYNLLNSNDGFNLSGSN